MAIAYIDDDDPPRHTENPVDHPPAPPPPQDMFQPPPPSQGPDINADLARVRGSVAIEAEDAAKLERLRQSPSKNESYESYLREIEEKQKRRAGPTLSNGGSGGDADRDGDGQLDPDFAAMLASAQSAGRQVGGASRTNFNYGNPGDQFDDPYTKALEDLVKQQLASIQQPQANPQLDRLLAFLDQQFTERSQNPGYSPAEQALLRTQTLEPIEADRAAAQRRSLERTAQRGFLPSSGLAELDSRNLDLDYDKLRGAAQRDLGVNAIEKRNQDLAQAITLGQLAGVQIPQQQRNEDQQRRNEAISLASLLYQLPRNAMNDSLAVINGSPLPNDMFQQAIQLMTAQEGQRRFDQQQNQQFWYQIGQTLAGLFG